MLAGSRALRDSDPDLIQDATGEKLGLFTADFFTFISGFVIAFVRGPRLAGVMLAVIPFLVIAGALLIRILSSATSKSQKAYGRAGAVAEEVLSSIRTVVSFNAEEKEMQRYAARLDDARRVGERKGWMAGAGIGFTYFSLYCSYGLAFFYGGLEISDGVLTSGTVFNSFFAVLIGAFALGRSIPHFSDFSKGMSAAYHVYAVIDRVPEIDVLGGGGLVPDSVVGHVELRNVHFHYPSRPDVPIMKGLSIKAEAGKTYALVGPSGCGKSTVIGLLERFYDPVEGEVLFDGRDIKTLDLRWLRSQFALVSQEPVLFDMTIGENIAFGANAQLSQAEIEQACKDSHIHDFIMSLPDGYNTRVGQRGTQLSGGQKQRIAIARALVRNPRVLLLDEATSALDTESEKIVQNALERARHGRTTFVIAHRLSTIRDADEIIVMEKGGVVERGTHSQLLQLPDGVYRGLVAAQELKQRKRHRSASVGQDASGETMPSLAAGVADADVFRDDSDNDDEEEEGGAEQGTGKANGAAGPTGDASQATKRIGTLEIASPEQSSTTRQRGCWPRKKPAADAAAAGARKADIRAILRLQRPEYGFLALGLIGSCIIGVIFPLYAVFFSQIIQVFTETGEQLRSGADFWAGMFVVLGAAVYIGQLLASGFYGMAAERLTKRIRELSFRAMLRQDVAWFDAPDHSSGALTALLATDAAKIESLTGTQMNVVTQMTVTVGVGLIVAFTAGGDAWKLTLVVLACVPLVALAFGWQTKAAVGFSKKGKNAYQAASVLATECISNIRTVAALSREQSFLDVFAQRLLAPQKVMIRRAHIFGLGYGVSQSLTFLMYAVVYYYGSVLVAENALSFMSMMRVFTAIVFSAMAAGQAASIAPDFGKAKVAAASVQELLATQPAIDASDPGGLQPPSYECRVGLEHVYFNYASRPSVKVLRDVSLSVEERQTVALVGGSGSGKSTVMALVERFYDPVEGRVLFGNYPVRDLNLAWLRRQISMVGQEPILLGATILDNIVYGVNEWTMDEVVAAAKASNIHDFIESLPEGYQTRSGEHGTQLSGGQKQRIAIARAIIRNPKLLLLDEATSALDSESEQVVQAALDRANVGRTTLVVAHRLSTIQNANRILVFRRGRIVESGTHDELLARRGAYYQLARRQLKGAGSSSANVP